MKENKILIDKHSCALALEKIKHGEVIIYPTDTLYGFGADATNSEAIKKINLIKKRISPLSIILSSIDDIQTYAYINEFIMDKITTLLPGPYTLLLKSKNNSNLSKYIQAGSDLIGIRVIKENFCNELIDRLSKPIVTTSVNIHTQKPLTKVDSIYSHFKNIPFFHKDNDLVSKGSTIINFSVMPEVVVRYGDGKY
tara:strand:- start:458 stop:1045 length:588 start_codon:yes stop_codon:yes gene_type:complete